MQRQWIDPEIVAIPQDYIDSIKGHRLLAQTLYRRGFKDIRSAIQFLDFGCYPETSPFELPNMDKAVSVLTDAIESGKLICVWGDFDVDGQTATTVLVTALRRLNGNVIHHIPVRARESHGVNLPVLTELISQGIDLLLTCDTGISSVEAVHYANQVGLPVIITDHHDLPTELPDTPTIINPKFLNSTHPLATLPGVGVAYKLAQALYTYNQLEDTVNEFLDLLALGIVADLATQSQETRYLLQRGLPVLRKMDRLGLKILSELADLKTQYLTEEHISFVIAPRLNALGRLADANVSIEFLSTTDPYRARTLAYHLEGLNANRKLLSEQVYRAALSQLESDSTKLHQNIIILDHPTWPAGVIGIAAARLAERFQKPVIIFSSPPGSPARGSARSVVGVNIMSAISSQAHLLVNYGGHPMAAGLAIDLERMAEFKQGINREISSQISIHHTLPKLQIDGFIGLNDLSPTLVGDIEKMAPFGIGNPPIILASNNLSITGYTAVGKQSEHLLVALEDELGYAQQAIWWGGADQELPDGKFDLAFTVRNSNYRGQKGIQLEWIDWRQLSTPTLLDVRAAREINVVDYRQEADSYQLLKTLLTNPDVQLWCEEDDCNGLQHQNRLSLVSCPILAFWSPPPGPVILRQILHKATPVTVYLFGNSSRMDQLNAFLARLAGLCKYALNHINGLISIAKLAASANQRPETVVSGLHWLQAHGQLEIIELTTETATIGTGSGKASSTQQDIESELRLLLNESAAYRKYFLREEKNRLINSANSDTHLD